MAITLFYIAGIFLVCLLVAYAADRYEDKLNRAELQRYEDTARLELREWAWREIQKLEQRKQGRVW